MLRITWSVAANLAPITWGAWSVWEAVSKAQLGVASSKCGPGPNSSLTLTLTLYISLYLATSRYTSSRGSRGPVSPYISLHLAISPYISLYLPTSRYTSPRGSRGPVSPYISLHLATPHLEEVEVLYLPISPNISLDLATPHLEEVEVLRREGGAQLGGGQPPFEG